MSQFIDGKTCDALSGTTGVVRDPSTGEVVAEITLAGAEDVDRAVQAARNAYAEWSRATPADRSAVLTTFAQLLSERAEEIARLESRIAGKPIRLASEFDVPGTIDNVAFFAGAARNLEGKASAEYSADHTSSIRREPVGVVGSISPWNYPLQMAAWKILPAIAAGNTIVLKPAELTPLTSLLFAEIGTEAGLPPGVVNVLTGPGADCGAVLLRHPDVEMVSFTGSTVVGRTVLEAAATNAKRVHLELGGKAPFVVFDDADLTAAIHGAVAGSLINTGQDCTAATRAIVHRSLYAEFVDGVADLGRGARLAEQDRRARHNAGAWLASPLDDEAAWDAGWARNLTLNLLAPATLCRLAIGHFRSRARARVLSARRGGSKEGRPPFGANGVIVNVASRSAHRGDDAEHLAYGAAKGGLLALTKGIARGFASERILAYAVAPGWVATDIAKEADVTGLAASLPMREITPPSDVAEVVAFLASGRSPHTTGATIDITGADYVR